MSNAWLKVKVWTKLTVLAVVLLYLLIFVFKNSGQPVKFWYWYNSEWNTSLLYFTFFTFLAGVLVMVLARTIYKTVGQFREMRRRNEQERRDRELRELQTKAAMLQTRADAGPAASTEPIARPADIPPTGADRPAP
jgi:uncharacterized integral membrane protein